MNNLNFSANIPETQAISQSQNERHDTTDPNVQTLNVTTIKPSSCASDNVQLYLQFFEYTHMVLKNNQLTQVHLEKWPFK